MVSSEVAREDGEVWAVERLTGDGDGLYLFAREVDARRYAVRYPGASVQVHGVLGVVAAEELMDATAEECPDLRELAGRIIAGEEVDRFMRDLLAEALHRQDMETEGLWDADRERDADPVAQEHADQPQVDDAERRLQRAARQQRRCRREG